MPETKWMIVTAPYFDRLAVTVTVDTDAPGITELIEAAMERSDIVYERLSAPDDGGQ